MKKIRNEVVPSVLVIYLVLCCLNSVTAIGFPEDSYYQNNYYEEQQRQFAKMKTAIGKLENGPTFDSNWPDPSIKLGQVSGVAVDNQGRVLVFHRASNVWDATTFSGTNVYQAIGTPPIPHQTILVFNDTGELVDMWGQDMFYIPHGITVDKAGNVWVTDVALHQVFKFTPDQRQKPALVLGENVARVDYTLHRVEADPSQKWDKKFVPGEDETHFCKPSAVAVLSSGEFFVADGYCNHRLIKYAPDGTKLLQWGKRFGPSPFVLNVPHALTLAEERGQLCVADRERGRVACFRHDSGAFVAAYSSWLLGPRIFSVAYSPVQGGRLYVVNGPSGLTPVRGYVLDFTTGRLLQTFSPPSGLSNPHDIVSSPDGSRVYVAELDPHKVYKFIDDSLRVSVSPNVTVSVPVKPTATVEVWSGASVGEAAGWVWGGAGAVLLFALLALVLLNRTNKGRKVGPRRHWEYGTGQFKLSRLLERRRFTRVHTDDSDDEPAPMLPPQHQNSATA